MGSEIDELAYRLLDGLDGRDAVELVDDFAAPLSTIVLARMLGVPDAEAGRFRDFSDTIIALTTLVMSDERRHELTLAAADFDDYVSALIADRRAAPRDDLISALLAARDPDSDETLSERSVISIVSQLIVAGHETTATLIANAVWLLLERRERWAAVLADRTLIEPALEEALRRQAPIKHLQRTARQDVVIDGVAIPAGARLLVGFAAANADPAAFSAPLEFRLDRSGDEPHLAFGRGKHFCLGAPLARLEAQIALEHLFDRFPRLELDPSDPPSRAGRCRSSRSRGCRCGRVPGRCGRVPGPAERRQDADSSPASRSLTSAIALNE
jgi:cytochrome P450